MHEPDDIARWHPETPPSLLSALRALLGKHRPAFRQDRPFRRAQALIFGHLFSFARRTVTQSLSWAWQRWEVEVCHREMKTGFGLGEIQCWSKEAAVLTVRWQAWAYGVLVLAGCRAWGTDGGPIRPPGRWWGGAKRWSLGSLWRGYRAELWVAEEFRPIFAATGDGWPEKEALLAGMRNAVNGSLRG